MVVHVNIREVDVLLLGQLSIFTIPGLSGLDVRHLGSPYGVGPALSEADVPEELVDAVIAEAAREGGVLHLLVAQHHHGWVTKPSHVHSLLKVHLNHALSPEPPPLLLLVLVPSLARFSRWLFLQAASQSRMCGRKAMTQRGCSSQP